MNSREEILHLINKYSFLIDSGDLEGWASLFEHGEWGVEGSPLLSGKQQILEMLNSAIIIYSDGTPRTRHVVSNVDIHVDEDNGVATSQSYITLLQQTDNLPLQVILSGTYCDDFERVQGKWRFAKRITKRVFFGDMSAHNRQL